MAGEVAVKVAFQGEPGAYSEQAIRKHFGTVPTLPCLDFHALFEAVRHGNASHAMLPVENSLAGTVAQSYELLLDYDVRVQAEVILRIEHMLLAPPHTPIDQIKRVKSHPQALAQCAAYLRRRGWEAVPAYDTAGSARELSTSLEPHTAAIAGALAAELYQLDILERGIEDEAANSTRFFVIGGHDVPVTDTPQKTSIVFAVRHHPGSLYECLGAFAVNQINLTKLESRPMRSRPWQYWFYLDFEGHYEETRCQNALNALLRKASMVKLLGSYPAASLP